LIHLRLGRRRCVIVTDTNVGEIYLKRLEAVLSASSHTLLPSIVVPAGEGSKSFEGLKDLLGQLFERGVDRQTLLIALGGGMVGDLTGLAASLVMRGMELVQIPTSLLAQVDSAVGGKTGINSDYGKNTIGTFYQPRLVLSDVTTLDSLPEREMKSGYAEVVKYGLICDAAFFQWCQAHGGQLLRGDREAQVYAVSKSCEHKARIVAIDERETGERALLNLGHTFGHALETMTGYGARLLHGEAVAIGMALAFRLSAGLGICPQKEAAMVQEHLKEFGLPVTPPPFAYDIDRLMELMGQDKKTRSGKLTLVLARSIGRAFISRDVNPSPVRTLWQGVLGETPR
jgi:3-dehydroquinate synthase